MADILIVEDEFSINELIRRNLCLTGHRCTQAFDGPTAVSLLESGSFDLIVLDIMLPGLDGYQVFERAGGTPAIFLTAKSELSDKLKGLAMGADDYLTKPFQMLELAARVETVLRRYHKTENRVVLDDVVVDTQSRVVTRSGKIIQLTAKEYNLLVLFLQNKNIALFRETIYERVWENEYMGDSRTVDLHVQRLRKKLGWQERIAAVYKVGYRLEVRE